MRRPTFPPQRLKPIVVYHGEIDRRAWECALLLKLRDELKAGNLSVRYSKRFARLEEFFIGDRRWQSTREDFFSPFWSALRYQAGTGVSCAPSRRSL
jgi:hypothetical protein